MKPLMSWLLKLAIKFGELLKPLMSWWPNNNSLLVVF